MSAVQALQLRQLRSWRLLPGEQPIPRLCSGWDTARRPDLQCRTFGDPTIGDELSAAGLSWRYYGEGYHTGPLSYYFCDICNPFEYSKSIMTRQLRNNIRGLTDFYNDLQNGTLPAVSFVKPESVLDGHPGSSTPILYEAFLKKLVTSVQAQTELYKSTVIFITTDESGGTYDSGYIQPIDFFGDGPRIPLIAVSPYAKSGDVDHTYGDHASLLKFIEANWRLKPLSSRSRDNLPNPSASASNPYVAANSPAVRDWMTMFNFNQLPAGTAAAKLSNGTSSNPQLTVPASVIDGEKAASEQIDSGAETNLLTVL